MLNNWKNRILQYKATPPDGLWQSIANKLDEDKLKERLLNHEEHPPKNLWKNIAAELDKDNTEKIPTATTTINKPRSIIFWKIGIAASIAAVIVVSTFVLLNKSDKSIASTPQKTQSKTTPVIEEEVLPNSTTIVQQKETASIIKKSDNPVIKNKAVSKNSQSTIDVPIDYVKGNEVEALAENPALFNKEKLSNADGDIVNDIAKMNISSGYVTITGPNGEVVKVSAKFSKILHSITDKNPEAEEHIDKVIKESKFWKGQFKTWRDKMTNNTIAPSLTNFMDIIELSKLVKE